MSAPTTTSVEPELVTALRSFGVELIVRAQSNGVILDGVSHSYYGKQMAQELVRRAGLVVVANSIVVERWRPTAWPGSPTPRSTEQP